LVCITDERKHDIDFVDATSSEIPELVALLNAVEPDGVALKLSALDQEQKQADLVAKVDQILTAVENRTAELTTLAFHRSYTSRIPA